MTPEQFFDLLDIPEPFVEESSGQPELQAAQRSYADFAGDAIIVHKHAACYEISYKGNTLIIDRK